MARADRVATLLIDIEAHLRRLNVWEDISPSEEALSSDQPFCIDTLSYSQWLQYIFLPTMYHLLESESPLPEECSIAPMAEEHFRGLGLPSGALERTLTALDQLISDTADVMENDNA
jgi:uncharacterized protein YqcC (DUF446 family)